MPAFILTIDFLGLVAGTLTTLAFVPQVVRSWRTRSARDLSLPTLVALVVGISLWIVYGVLVAATPVILANAVTLALVAMILLIKVRDDRRAP